MKFENVVLEGQYVRLEPLSIEHKKGLCEAVADGELWNLFVTKVPRIEAMDEFIANANTVFEEGDGLVFATVNKATAEVVGSTRFMRASLVNKRVEIGFTFLAASAQRTEINTEAKLLMLEYAFETLKLNRVEFLTDYLNQQSRNAILRLGAKQEGVLRNHVLMPNGRVRDSVLFSIIQNEWLGVKQHLTAKLECLA
ncbi:GNAT family N-acetyltransferase [Zhongshania aliphaticivorans]|uniref:GNAT family N-acetyltransferase n=1 Tax=Zhongshania aliphaticivorans TaxID=1470434 RepID=UPI0012E485B3|nr:GNAT family protein [Zhongshania aliphaticivorans]CAA0097124.1 Putative ribosomal N-acetyltransferase YdaF [Zhongshania aliphaticivorans]